MDKAEKKARTEIRKEAKSAQIQGTKIKTTPSDAFKRFVTLGLPFKLAFDKVVEIYFKQTGEDISKELLLELEVQRLHVPDPEEKNIADKAIANAEKILAEAQQAVAEKSLIIDPNAPIQPLTPPRPKVSKVQPGLRGPGVLIKSSGIHIDIRAPVENSVGNVDILKKP